MRITPTCVGNTLPSVFHIPLSWDHPHLCGEHLTDKDVTDSELGSPPPVWGTLRYPLEPIVVVRITPTCVGNTIVEIIKHGQCWDHPHLCGEHCCIFGPARKGPGSPPPVWGTQTAAKELQAEIRITPTCVGNTQLRNRPCR